MDTTESKLQLPLTSDHQFIHPI